jgi:diaminopimelate epimerase
MALDFVKLHGLGNDFVVVDRRARGTPVPPAEVRALCDRHTGVGADGVLSLLRSERAALAMHVTNADGSFAEMCGNGLRCVVRYAIDRGLLDPQGGPVETGRGVLSCTVEPDGQVRVDMGRPILDPDQIRCRVASDRAISLPLQLGDALVAFTAVSMGNPHAIVFVDEGEPLSWAQRFGPELERSPLFPQRTNAEFARVQTPDRIDLVVWERGAGITQACGTGACATAVAAVLTGRSPAGAPLQVTLPGGVLRIVVEPDLSRVWMTGPAVEVFSGHLDRGGPKSSAG